MRIVGGTLRGKAVSAPEGAATRPTSDRARESLFNRLEHGDYGFPAPPRDRRVLDLFAGSGALGLEALSRGAAFCVFIDDAAAARAAIRVNIEACALIGSTKLYRRDARTLGPCRVAPFDLVFVDPPYGRDLVKAALDSARSGGWLAPGAVIVMETGADEPRPDLPWLPEGDRRKVGAAALEIATLTV